MKSEKIFEGVNQQIKVFDSAGDKKIFGRLSHFRRSVYGIRICFEIMKFHFDEDINKIECTKEYAVPYKSGHRLLILAQL